MSFWTPPTFERVTSGRWLQTPGAPFHGASIDTRSLRPGQVFFALPGERVDGHEYLGQAAEAGAAFAVVERDVEAPRQLGVLLVANVRAALAQLASAYRATFTSTRVIAVTGSAGKTTTVRLIEAALSTLRGGASEKSFNNDLGVPLTILNAEPDVDYLICEVGTNAPGEIESLSTIIKPDIAVITTIGRAHLEGFGSIEAIAREKASVAAPLRPGGWLVANIDAPQAPSVIDHPSLRSYGLSDRADVRLEQIDTGAHGTNITLADGFSARIPFIGRHNGVNAAGAVCVARLLGVDDGDIARGLARAAPAAHRLIVENLGDVTLIDDAYNANPESMLAALAVLRDIDARRRVAVIGDMLELGEHAAQAHLEIADAARGVTCVFVGPFAAAAAGESKAIEHPTDKNLAELASMLRPGDAVLVKASRGMRLERVCEAIRRRFRMQPAPAADNREADARLPQ